MSGREAVIVGMGLISPLGLTVEENWQRLSAGEIGIRRSPNELLPESFHYVGKVGEFEIPAPIAPGLMGQMKFLSRGSRLGLAAACEAVGSENVLLCEVPAARRALYIGSGDFSKSGHEFLHQAIEQSAQEGGLNPEKLNAAALATAPPFFLLESIANNLFSFLSALLEFRGPNTSLGSLSPYGAQSLELAASAIAEGRADVALAIGCGTWISEFPLYELDGLGLLSKCKSGAQSFRPFDRARDGFIPGEGGAALLLAAEEVARRHAAPIFGRVAGTANCIEFAPGLGVPPKVAARSARMALSEAACEVSDLAFICAHGSATQRGDRSELMSLSEILGERAEAPICGLKPYTGHMGAASDLAEIMLGIEAARRGLAPATPNFREPEKEFSALKISNRPQPCAQKQFLSVSYGMGGQSSSIVIAVE